MVSQILEIFLSSINRRIVSLYNLPSPAVLGLAEIKRWAGRAKEIDLITRQAGRMGMSDVGPGSGGNVIAALSSFFIPGLGQLLQGRLVMAFIQFCLAGILWIFLLGWLVHLWSIIDAARFVPNR